MKREEIIKLAREAGATPYTNRHYPDRPTHTFNPEQLQKFVAMLQSSEASLRNWSVLAARALDDADRVLQTIEPESWTEGESLEELRVRIKDLFLHALTHHNVMSRGQLDERYSFTALARY